MKMKLSNEGMCDGLSPLHPPSHVPPRVRSSSHLSVSMSQGVHSWAREVVSECSQEETALSLSHSTAVRIILKLLED
jgi:hypothetical protein